MFISVLNQIQTQVPEAPRSSAKLISQLLHNYYTDDDRNIVGIVMVGTQSTFLSQSCTRYITWSRILARPLAFRCSTFRITATNTLGEKHSPISKDAFHILKFS